MIVFELIPDGLEPSLPGCRPGVVAAGPRDRVVLKSGPTGNRTRPVKFRKGRFAGPASSCWTMSPFFSGSRGTRTHKRDSPATCFQDRLLIRPDDFREVAGVGIEPTTSWVRARRCYQQQPPRSVVSNQRLAFSEKVRGGGFEPSLTASKAGGLPLADPRECPVGVEPTFPAWKAGAFAARPRAHELSRRKERESNPQGSSLDRFRNGCHRQLACPSVKLRRQESNLCQGG